ncbi:putative ATP-dependent RNA helicase DDX56 [Lamellibrachia satsuma]|nr:putative ATP-dependent RNA helicase DDX56 [Lamellibrachia satsuma]
MNNVFVRVTGMSRSEVVNYYFSENFSITVILKLEESQLPESGQLTQYHIKCEEEDKFVLIYALNKLRLIRGKSIVFVNTIERCYRLKLYLEQFAIPSCVLNSELPVNSRCHIVNQFNEGLYDLIIVVSLYITCRCHIVSQFNEGLYDLIIVVSLYVACRCHIVNQFNEGLYDLIIAADEVAVEDASTRKDDSKKQKRWKKDKEAGVARGIDFQNIANVINFDFPPNPDAYVHRVGRTARGDRQGTALSFVSVKEMPLLETVEKALADTYADGETTFKPYQFKMEELDGFRNRAEDARRAVTKVAVREARLKEIKAELLNSYRLKSYFEDNTRDLQLLRHDKCLHTARIQSHLKHVPDYLVPKTLRHISSQAGRSMSSRKRGRGPSTGQRKYKKKKADPLKSFQFSGLTKKRKKT